MENTKLILSRRLIIRRFEEADLEKNLEFIKDPKFFYMSKVENEKELIETSISNYENKKNYNFWHIVNKGMNDSIGTVKASDCENGVRIYIIINKSLRNRGYGREALEAVIDYFFTLEQKQEVFLKSEKNNESFKTLIDKLHFKKYDEDTKYNFYKMDNLDYMKYFAIFGDI
ncbi:MAG: GNAT family N-acetyltransferase [Anaerococcus hydrogenalis]|uniref:GNAT family N-acetyltransferase n=1 Tax=Anaerococcus hydrogenalis TaxID=33029 RepID=UPI0029046498|nr:GNAT family N-acetyltransferase [Anaerococcus hydrogenalis]MDU1316339.1 GNAT family N-acetyltransferase [Anaerococcus hydrogenalis]MDU3153556.1 GNAT family N-acetyltransferase [Anaerococcus hydrogenalis]MDU3198805.1 GNAT family N-acetyltransferase [Anaerococcus hydrogenalis]MDU3687765.1 GNAT family N-acetyltransferase [Anaerococcus hydrogenalis]